jgi:hypothetical protein
MILYITKPCTGTIVSRGMGNTEWWFGEKNLPHNPPDMFCELTGERIYGNWHSRYDSNCMGKLFEGTKLYKAIWLKLIESEGFNTIDLMLLMNAEFGRMPRPIPEWYVHHRIWILKIEFTSFNGKFKMTELRNANTHIGQQRIDDEIGYPWNTWYDRYTWKRECHIIDTLNEETMF